MYVVQNIYILLRYKFSGRKTKVSIYCIRITAQTTTKGQMEDELHTLVAFIHGLSPQRRYEGKSLSLSPLRNLCKKVYQSLWRIHFNVTHTPKPLKDE